MKSIYISILMALVSLTACKKENFPKKEYLEGTWTEETEKDFKHKLTFEGETMYFFKPNRVDTLLYRLDSGEKRMYLKLNNSSSNSETEHHIRINKKKDELTIWNLFISFSTETTTTFKKE